MDSPDNYPRIDEDNIRFSDTDALGHVNNTAVAAYLETGRGLLMEAVGTLGGEAGLQTVIVRLEIDYIAEMRWPGRVVIGTRIAALGRSSVTIEQALFQDGRCTARARSVVVAFDMVARCAVPIPDEHRARYRVYMVPEG